MNSIENKTSNEYFNKVCYQSCNRVKYSINEKEKFVINNTILEIESYGEDFKEYFLRQNSLYEYFETKPYTTFPDEIAFITEKMQKTSLIHINFEESGR